MARTFYTQKDEINIIESLFLLTGKPILYVANVDETEIVNNKRNDYVQSLFDFADNENNLAIRLCGKIEQEIADLNKEEKSLFLDEYNLQEPGLNKLIHAGFNLLVEKFLLVGLYLFTFLLYLLFQYIYFWKLQALY